MKQSGCGRYCERCERVVIDMTQKTRAEIKEILSHNPQTCGRYYPYQLLPPLPSPKTNWFSTGIMLMSAFFSSVAFRVMAQKAPTKQPHHKQQVHTHTKPWNGDKSVVEGRVLQEGGKPVFVARIELLNDPKVFTYTDTAGRYTLKLPAHKDTARYFSIVISWHSEHKKNNTVKLCLSKAKRCIS
jgi:hypothetical protein